MPLPAGAVVSVASVESDLFCIQFPSTIVLPSIGAQGTFTVSDSISGTITRKSDDVPSEVYVEESLNCRINVTLDSVCVLNRHHYVSKKSYSDDEENTNHIQTFLVSLPVNVESPTSSSTFVAPGESSVISINLSNPTTKDSKSVKVNYSANHPVSVVGFSVNGSQCEVNDLVIPSVPANSTVPCSLVFRVAETIPLGTSLQVIISLNYDSLEMCNVTMPFSVEAFDPTAKPDVLLVVTPETPKNELPIWCELLKKLGLTYLLWDCQSKDGFSFDSKGKRHDNSWRNIVNEEGNSSFKVVMVLYCSYDFIKNIHVQDILWLHNSGTGLVFLRGNHTGQLFLQKLLSDWYVKAPFHDGSTYKDTGKFRNSLQKSGDVAHRHHLAIVDGSEPVLNDLEFIQIPPKRKNSILETKRSSNCPIPNCKTVSFTSNSSLFHCCTV
ncbi:hypothetical protein GEMRC1_010578 [Eukaryota sp. GEM-RC1]